jgi:hypothetical protein
LYIVKQLTTINETIIYLQLEIKKGMNLIETKQITTIDIDEQLLHDVQQQVDYENQMIVHCSYTGLSDFDAIRIWPTTFLLSTNFDTYSQLTHIENLSAFPQWTPVAKGETKTFTLYFAKLPKAVQEFTFAEIISEPGAFMINDIPRNKKEVYHVNLNS